MPAIAAASAIVGAGISVYGAIQSANDQANLDNTRARIATQQADELAGREASNEAVRNQQATRQMYQFGSSYAASGKAGVGIGSQLQIQSQANLANITSNRESQFQQTMLQEQAGIDTTLAAQTEQAGTLNAIGAGLRGVGGVAGIATAGGANPGYGGPQSMGVYPMPQGGGASPGLLGGG